MPLNRRAHAAVLVMVSATLAGAPAATAAGGNSDNAKRCQMNGWTQLVRADATPFRNDGDCVSYAAKGGVLMPRVTVALVEITVVPVTSTVPAGRTEQLTALGTFSDGTTQDITSAVTWSSSQRTVAVVSNATDSAGRVTGISPGTTQITAARDGVVGTATVTVPGAAT
jgi:hypothetical protein